MRLFHFAPSVLPAPLADGNHPDGRAPPRHTEILLQTVAQKLALIAAFTSLSGAYDNQLNYV